eukprot:436083-Pelagomonas_calceolata.AAC.1
MKPLPAIVIVARVISGAERRERKKEERKKERKKEERKQSRTERKKEGKGSTPRPKLLDTKTEREVCTRSKDLLGEPQGLQGLQGKKASVKTFDC